MLHTRFIFLTVGLGLGLFLGMLGFLELGRRLGREQVRKHGGNARTGVGVVDGVVYSLLGLLVGFSFSGAADRFDARRRLIGDEVNAIGIAWLHISILPPESQPLVRGAFNRYLGALLIADSSATDTSDVFIEPMDVANARRDVWEKSVAACSVPSGERARMLLLPALGNMFASVARERLARRIHPPKIVYVMLGLTALAAALFAGYAFAGSRTRNWMYMVGIAAAVSISAYVILDLEYPRLGVFRVDPLDRVLTDMHSTLR
jgi:hypothetical protein